MDPQLQALYARVKAREISPEEAAEQFKWWKARHQQGPERHLDLVHETPTKSTAPEGSALLEPVLAAVIQAASHVLKVDAHNLDGDVTLCEYGFDQVKLAELFRYMSEAYDVALTPDLLHDYPTLHGVARYLVDAFGDALRERFQPRGIQVAVTPATSNPVSSIVRHAVGDRLREGATHYFKHMLSASLKIPLQSLDANAAMEQYGINSVLVVELTSQLEKVFGSLPKTLFFEYQSLGELTEYFLAHHEEKLQEALNSRASTATPGTTPDAAPSPGGDIDRRQGTMAALERHQSPRPPTPLRASSPRQDVFDVAIIGLSGRYPGADNLAQFWENLQAGRHGITEIPTDRWDWRVYFDTAKGKLGSIYTKWGGFLSEIDTFDPLFFRISPAEAQNMDPQERLFIEEAYAAIEDAGYTPATLGGRSPAVGRSDRRIGVFVGVMNSTYGANARYWSIANRVSYLFDLQGPSLAVDTACSSSLTAIHLALESLYRGTCDCAIAGGVNLIVDPIHYQGLSVMTMLSPTDQCKAFGDQADGFVAGEGVGVLLLKPLSRAMADDDHIYGVIKGSMVNAGGKTNGYTVPNPRAQARVIAEAFRRAGIDPYTVSYVEAHGTGTALGDPIEIVGLTQAFAQAAGAARSGDTQFCRIGSVKSNIGHLESAAGIAGVTKVLLQLQHRQLVPSLHATVLSPAIDFEKTPFVVQQELAAWPRPQREVDGAIKEFPRIAAISSFGAGGANAHLIVEEYIAEQAEDHPSSWLPDRRGADDARLSRPALIVLSAKHEAQLKERARRLLGVLREGGRAWSNRDLVDMAYTLQVGREAMEERLAMAVRSSSELAEKLTRFLDGRDDVPDLFRGRAAGAPPASMPPDLSLFAEDEDLQLALGSWIDKGKYGQLLSLWVKGLAIDWDALLRPRTAESGPNDVHPRRVSLPTYPFAKERYWAHRVTGGAGLEANGLTTIPATLHPLLHHNTSDLTEQRFSSTFNGREFFLADHMVRGQRTLPAVAYLEMAREAVQRAAGAIQGDPAEILLADVVWMRPLLVGETPVEVHIGLVPEEPGHQEDRSVHIAYEIYTLDEAAARVVHSQGRARLGAVVDTSRLDLVALQAQCNQGSMDAGQCYEAFKAMGLDYGPGHRGMQHLSVGSGQVLARLAVPDHLRDRDDRFVLHPSLLDAALQAILGLLGSSAAAAEASRPALPFALRELSMVGECSAAMWAWVRDAGTGPGDTTAAPNGVRDLDIDVCDESGAVRVRLRGLSLRMLDTSEHRTDNVKGLGPSLMQMLTDSGAKGELLAPASAVRETALREKAAAYLAKLLASVIGVPEHRLAGDTALGEYGMDSVMAMQVISQLEKPFGPLSKTLLFEYPDLQTLTDYFFASHAEQLQAVLGVEPEGVPAAAASNAAVAAVAPAITRGRPRFAASQPTPGKNSADIAVIGLAGRYPKANTLNEFWENLRTGRDCITEVPPERWDHGHYFDPEKNTPGKAYSKWGGFLDEVDCFDPLFFNISPRDAEIMDPQERLFLECTWHLLENAGHTRELLRLRYQSRVGVYVGAMSQQYHAFDADLIRESAIALSSYYSIANRVSYFCDFQGPSMAIDTACSSALVAIHMACESLLKGECRLAVAGGVNLSIHPKKYLALSLAQIVGSHPNSRSFADGDGYIPAEGVGAVLLKPLAQAVRDGDSILAVIKSSAINHSGHTHGYSVPNPQAQAQVIIDNFRKAGIDPRTISYVESAANGSALGDPLEIIALTKAFREFTRDRGFCAIGSVKSNIGHAEAASGMSQLTKVILQLQHGLLAPTIKAEPLNPNLSFDDSPFYLQRELSEWRRPMADGVGEYPRRATVSSIGAGGSNAHLIVEEYIGAGGEPRSLNGQPSASLRTVGMVPEPGEPGLAATADSLQIAVLSAKSMERLRAVAEHMLGFVQQHPECALADLASTLQMGRDAMSSRLAMVVHSRDELVRGLEEFLQIVGQGTHLKPGALAVSLPMFIGDLEGDGAEIRSLFAGKAGEAIVQVFLAEHNLEKLALHWTQGGDIPWESLHAGKRIRRVHLPNYPFARQRYWVAGDGSGEGSPSDQPAWVHLHPDPRPEGGRTGGLQRMTSDSFEALSTHDRISYVLTAVLSEELGIPRDEITPHKDFQDYGADSIAVLKMTRGIEEIFGAKVTGREMLQYPTVASLSSYLTAKLERTRDQPVLQSASSEVLLVPEASAPLNAVQIDPDPFGNPLTDGEYREATLLHQWFEVHARKTPERIAVVFNDTNVTYRALDARSMRLATYLQQQGAGPETLVGLCLPRSLDMMVGVLGILKAGAAYVPLDPGLAAERIDYIVGDSRMGMLVTCTTARSRLQDLQAHHPRLNVIELDRVWQDMLQGSPYAPQHRIHGDNLAYMIYTSGSTGQPKGVTISHRAAAEQCQVVRSHWGLDAGTRVLQFTPLSFDASVEQVFATLAAGACLVLADPVALAPKVFSLMLMTQQINILNIPPAFALELLRDWQHHPELIPPALQTLITGGDVLAVEAVQLWQHMLRDRVTLLNAYGPTETTVTACLHTVVPTSDAITKIPLGHPLGHRHLYILNHDGQPMPSGEAGEIHIGGRGVSRGYWHRPALTGAAFIPDAWTNQPGARLYKSGDLGRFLSDGSLEFLGRIDHQVKIRGYRIELGEIEAALAGHTGVAQAAAMTVNSRDDKRLVGYVVAKHGYEPSPQDLQHYLRQKLPAYMVPSRFMVLERMPLTSSGKIDRLALPVPPKLDGQTVTPARDELEQQLARIWEELLDVSNPGIQDDFFAMGGHSILAIRLLALIRDRCGMELPLATLLQAPTIEALAQILRGDSTIRDFAHLVTLQKGAKRPFFCVPGVGGTVFYFLKLASLLGRDQPFYGLQSRGVDGEMAPYTSVEDIAYHYVQAIQTVQPAGPYLLGGHSFGGHIAFEMAMQLEALGHEVGALVLIDCPAPGSLNLSQTWNESALLLAFASILGIGINDHPDLVRKMLSEMDRDEKLAVLYEAVIRLDAFPLPVDRGQFRGIFQVYLTNSLMQYTPQGQLNHTMMTLLAAERPHSEALIGQEAFARITSEPRLLQRLQEMSAAWAEYDREILRLWTEDAQLGWSLFSSRPIEVRHVPGNHMDMIHEPHVHVLAAALRQTIQADTTAAAPAPPAPVTAAHYPLSKVQEGLWLLQKFSPEMSAYNVPVAIRFKQDFEVDIFRRTCAYLLDQHPILGSVCVEVNGKPRQYIPAQRPFAFEHEVIDHLDERDLVPFLSAKVKQPFDLARGPLMRVHLFSRQRGAERDHIGLITIHHIVFDGTSSVLLARALVSTYHALSQGREPSPVANEASYQDFVCWEQAMMAGPEGREHLAWWQQHLAGELPVLALRTDHPRPAVRGFSGATIEASIDPSLSERLRVLARSQRVSLSTLLLGLYKVLLHRYTHQEDLIVGMPTMGRPKNVFDRVMGCFINMMAVRSRVSGEQSFSDYLKTLQLIMIDSLDHAVYPFSELVRELNVDRDQSISPIFQTYYAYQNYVAPAGADLQHAEREGALHTEFLKGIHQEGDKDLGLEVYEEADRFTLNIKYNPELYESATMRHLLEHFTHLAAAVVEQPYGSIAGFDVFSAEHKTTMLRDWNNTALAFPKAQLLFQLFEEQVARTPDCTAVIFKDQVLSYAELEKRSSALAAYLQQHGVGPETFVGLYLGRSMEIVIGAMGILKAGGVYVPLDPALPEERLAYMIEDANVALLLTTELLASQAQAFKKRVSRLELIYLDKDWSAIDHCHAFYTPPTLQPENLAYVIYTSGSTGRPKGVMISHLTTTRHCYAIRDYFRMAPGERVCLQSPISFDASIEQIFAPLSIGATVAIRDLEVLSPKPFSAMLADLKVNIIQLPPAFILALFREWQLNPRLIPADLTLLISCGDVLAVETVRLWQTMLKDRVTLLNVYGPTEVTAKATFHQVEPDLDTQHLARIPIGRPLANKQIYILDRYAYPTPIGVPGELHIGGTGPGRGYHGRPALTAEKFLPDPFSDAAGARFYNSGDLAYFRDDGSTEFLGRIDHQVKVRGHRIELGEIEAIVAAHPDVKSAAVITVDMREDKRIVAYVVGKDGRALEPGDLKAFVGRQLPDYMVPSAFVCLEQMPLTPSGKINRRGLPLPQVITREDSVTPRDAVELELTRIWEQVLEVPHVDIRQDFFALGGHSLLAIRLMVLIEARMGRELPLATLFQAPTIEQLADILRADDGGTEPTIVTLQALGAKLPFFCVPGAGGTALYLNELARQLGQDQPFYAFQAKGLDGRSEPYTSVASIAEHYIQAMRAVQPQGPYVLGGHSFGGRVAFEMARALEHVGQTIEHLVLLDCSAPGPNEPGHGWDDTTLLIAFAAALGLDIGADLDLLSGIVADQELDHTLARILGELKQHRIVLPDTSITRIKGLFQVFHANNQMTYAPQGPINAPISLFKASDFQPEVIDHEYFRQAIDDPAVLARIEAMNRTWAQFNEAVAKAREDAHLGWDRYTTATVTASAVPGDHMTLVREPHASALARVMRACLAG